eukprot:TRINITY_DN4100_c0_g2_i13.p1 TRINITY_DN4100_c0_g2~~TRINITY_DN4100_c0_g2_i13.p1  ORF type:complete len:378 (+),score=79.78 TRINITY_DN4100_c0_g2_i13:2007-3140(+)
MQFDNLRDFVVKLANCGFHHTGTRFSHPHFHRDSVDVHKHFSSVTQAREVRLSRAAEEDSEGDLEDDTEAEDQIGSINQEDLEDEQTPARKSPSNVLAFVRAAIDPTCTDSYQKCEVMVARWIRLNEALFNAELKSAGLRLSNRRHLPRTNWELFFQNCKHHSIQFTALPSGYEDDNTFAPAVIQKWLVENMVNPELSNAEAARLSSQLHIKRTVVEQMLARAMAMYRANPTKLIEDAKPVHSQLHLTPEIAETLMTTWPTPEPASADADDEEDAALLRTYLLHNGHLDHGSVTRLALQCGVPTAQVQQMLEERKQMYIQQPTSLLQDLRRYVPRDREWQMKDAMAVIEKLSTQKRSGDAAVAQDVRPARRRRIAND